MTHARGQKRVQVGIKELAHHKMPIKNMLWISPGSIHGPLLILLSAFDVNDELFGR